MREIYQVKTETRPQALVPREKKRVSWRLFIFLWFLLLIVGTAGYFYYDLKKGSEAEQDTADIVKHLSKFIDLPPDETPGLATITNREKLNAQPFFVRAENGDKILIYSNNKRVILYRPSTKKLIDMTVLNVESQVPTDSNTKIQTAESIQSDIELPEPETFRVAIKNGTPFTNFTKAAEAQLQAFFPGAGVTSVGNAVKQDYPQTVVVNISGIDGGTVQKIAEELEGVVGSLPEGEALPPDADILIVLGVKNETPAE